jgi:hypothetical protein
MALLARSSLRYIITTATRRAAAVGAGV